MPETPGGRYYAPPRAPTPKPRAPRPKLTVSPAAAARRAKLTASAEARKREREAEDRVTIAPVVVGAPEPMRIEAVVPTPIPVRPEAPPIAPAVVTPVVKERYIPTVAEVKHYEEVIKPKIEVAVAKASIEKAEEYAAKGSVIAATIVDKGKGAIYSYEEGGFVPATPEEVIERRKFYVAHPKIAPPGTPGKGVPLTATQVKELDPLVREYEAKSKAFEDRWDKLFNPETGRYEPRTKTQFRALKADIEGLEKSFGEYSTISQSMMGKTFAELKTSLVQIVAQREARREVTPYLLPSGEISIAAALSGGVSPEIFKTLGVPSKDIKAAKAWVVGKEEREVARGTLAPYYMPGAAQWTIGPRETWMGGYDIRGALAAGVPTATILAAGFTAEQVKKIRATFALPITKPFPEEIGKLTTEELLERGYTVMRAVEEPAVLTPVEKLERIGVHMPPEYGPESLFGPAGPLREILYPTKEEYAARYMGLEEGRPIWLGRPEPEVVKWFKEMPVVGPAITTGYQWEYLTPFQRGLGIGEVALGAALIGVPVARAIRMGRPAPALKGVAFEKFELGAISRAEMQAIGKRLAMPEGPATGMVFKGTELYYPLYTGKFPKVPGLRYPTLGEEWALTRGIEPGRVVTPEQLRLTAKTVPYEVKPYFAREGPAPGRLWETGYKVPLEPEWLPFVRGRGVIAPPKPIVGRGVATLPTAATMTEAQLARFLGPTPAPIFAISPYGLPGVVPTPFGISPLVVPSPISPIAPIVIPSPVTPFAPGVIPTITPSPFVTPFVTPIRPTPRPVVPAVPGVEVGVVPGITPVPEVITVPEVAPVPTPTPAPIPAPAPAPVPTPISVFEPSPLWAPGPAPALEPVPFPVPVLWTPPMVPEVPPPVPPPTYIAPPFVPPPPIIPPVPFAWPGFPGLGVGFARLRRPLGALFGEKGWVFPELVISFPEPLGLGRRKVKLAKKRKIPYGAKRIGFRAVPGTKMVKGLRI